VTELTGDRYLEKKDWLIYDRKSECFWGPNRGGYWKSIVDAGLYTEAEAKAAQASAERSSERMEVARPLEQYRAGIERLATALGPSAEAVRLYHTDAMFHALVASFALAITRGTVSAAELGDAVRLAVAKGCCR
jgi:hypothetical protein